MKVIWTLLILAVVDARPCSECIYGYDPSTPCIEDTSEPDATYCVPDCGHLPSRDVCALGTSPWDCQAGYKRCDDLYTCDSSTGSCVLDTHKGIRNKSSCLETCAVAPTPAPPPAPTPCRQFDEVCANTADCCNHPEYYCQYNAMGQGRCTKCLVENEGYCNDGSIECCPGYSCINMGTANATCVRNTITLEPTNNDTTASNDKWDKATFAVLILLFVFVVATWMRS